jgi:hypothetical protein
MADDPYDWDSRVEAWEEVAATGAFLELRDRIRKEAAPLPDDRILDLGAGTGLVTLAFAPHAETVGVFPGPPNDVRPILRRGVGAGPRLRLGSSNVGRITRVAVWSVEVDHPDAGVGLKLRKRCVPEGVEIGSTTGRAASLVVTRRSWRTGGALVRWSRRR